MQTESGLVALATPVLNLILRLRAGLDTPSGSLRSTIEKQFEILEKEGAKLKYRDRQLENTKYALAAIVDETVLTIPSDLRGEWREKPLQLQFFGVHTAGVRFFQRLEELLKADETEAEVVEIYYLCLRFGFQGRYIHEPAKLEAIIKDSAEYLRRANRLEQGELSPHWKMTDQPEVPSPAGLPQWLRIGAIVSVGLLVLTFVVLTYVLNVSLSQAKESLLR
jgi:type VI secretion system protein ImpK